MKIGLLIPLRAFRRNSGIVTWMVHMDRLAKELGLSLCCLSHVPIARLRDFYLFREAIDDLEGLGLTIVGPDQLTTDRLLTGLEAAIEKYQIETIISSDPVDYLDLGPDLANYAKYLYEHSGCFIRNKEAIKSYKFFTENVGMVKSLCVTEQAKAFMQSIGRPVVEAVAVQPFIVDKVAKPETTIDRLVGSSGGITTKRDTFTIELCQQAEVPFAGFGTKSGYTHLPRAEFLEELYKSKGMIHLSSEEMVSYSVLEAAVRVPVIVDKDVAWVKDLEGYGIPMVGIDTTSPAELREVYANIDSYTERLDVEAYKARCLDSWRQVFDEIL